MPAGILYHYRIRAVNLLGEESPNSNYYMDNPVRTGTVEFPVGVFVNASTYYVNQTTCFDNILQRPRCNSIENAISAFEEVVDMRYGLTSNIYYWTTPLKFGREGASIEKLLVHTNNGVHGIHGVTGDVIVDCMHHRCFKQCVKPKYLISLGIQERCFGPSKLISIRFRNAKSNDGPGAVLSSYPSVIFQQVTILYSFSTIYKLIFQSYII